jgi:hypothetical protein
MTIFTRIQHLFHKASLRAKQLCPENKGRSSTTPDNRWFNYIKEEAKHGKINDQGLSDIEMLLKSVAEKRRLTIDWRGGMLTNAQLIKATARRVGLVAPELASDKGRE